MNADEIIALLDLRPLPIEGGYFAETHRSDVPAPEFPGFTANPSRPLKTAIYYLLTPDTISAIHRLPGDEIFHVYLGDPVQQLHLMPDGSGRTVVLGANLLAGERPQVTVPGGVWQGARLLSGPHGFALLGTTMSPGFHFEDFEAGSFAELTARYPRWRDEIALLIPRKP